MSAKELFYNNALGISTVAAQKKLIVVASGSQVVSTTTTITNSAVAAGDFAFCNVVSSNVGANLALALNSVCTAGTITFQAVDATAVVSFIVYRLV